MKKLLVLSNIVTAVALAVVLYTGCERAKPTPCTTTCYPPVTNPYDGLDSRLAIALVDNYRHQQWSTYRQYSPGRVVDSRAVWFNLDTLKRFIHTIESSACKNCPKGDLTLGLRVYFGTYPTADAWKSFGLHTVLGDSLAGRHTVLMVPTYFSTARTEHVDFDPLHWGEDGCTPTRLTDLLDTGMYAGAPPVARIAALVPSVPPAGDAMNLQNHGHPFPPPYDGRFENPPGSSITSTGADFASAVDGVR